MIQPRPAQCTVDRHRARAEGGPPLLRPPEPVLSNMYRNVHTATRMHTLDHDDDDTAYIKLELSIASRVHVHVRYMFGNRAQLQLQCTRACSARGRGASNNLARACGTRAHLATLHHRRRSRHDLIHDVDAVQLVAVLIGVGHHHLKGLVLRSATPTRGMVRDTSLPQHAHTSGTAQGQGRAAAGQGEACVPRG